MRPDELSIEKMSLSKLRRLQRRAAVAIRRREARDRHEALAAAEAAAHANGYTLAELVATPERSGRSQAVRYRHPDRPDLTWCGRGRPPNWIKQAVKAGREIAAFQVGA